jgi:DNA helicase-4
MRISPSALAVFFGRAGDSPVSLQLEDGGLRVLRNAGEEFIPYERIDEPFLEKNLFWASVFLGLKDGSFVIGRGFSKAAATAFSQEISNKQTAFAERRLTDELQERSPAIMALAAQIRAATSGSRYLRYRDCEALLTQMQPLVPLLKARDDQVPSLQLRVCLELITKFVSAPEDARQNCNRQFAQSEKERFREFFDHIEAQPLTDTQRSAVVTDEDNTLVIAGAGSGKTSVIVAKAGYLVKRETCKPEQILLLAFNRDAKEEIEERLEKRVGVSLKAATFHSLGLEIIAQVEGKKPSVSVEASDHVRMLSTLKEIMAELQEKPEFAGLIKTFFGYHLVPYRNLFDFQSEGEYWDYLQAHEVRSLQGDIVKSLEELEIANFLFLNGINYEYERHYRVNTGTVAKRQYQPDFTILEPEIYIEHFCLNKHQWPPPFIDGREYLEGVKWKRELHTQQRTTLIETYSHQHLDGTLLTELERKLKSAGVKFNPIIPASMFKKLGELGVIDRFTGLLATVLHHFKSNLHTLQSVQARVKASSDGPRIAAFLRIFEAVFAEYQARLRSTGQVDFDDMIVKATGYVEAGQYRSTFNYILVDEFQDISKGRARLVKALLHQKANSGLFGVGDDWQAIYRFAGSDISLMRNFESEFGHSDLHRLDRTFRYNNQINDLSSKFILKNPKQIPKSVTPNSSTDSVCVWIHRTESPSEEIVHGILNEVAEDAQGKKVSVLMLGRYNHLAPAGLNALVREFPRLSIKYLTIHRSKGLEADYVIILGLEAGKFGFPSEIVDDPILDLVMSEPEEFPDAEERRLFVTVHG